MLVTIQFFGKEFTKILRKRVSQETGSPPAIIYDGGVATPFISRKHEKNHQKSNMDIKIEAAGQADVLADAQHPNKPAPKWAAMVKDKFVPAPQQRVEVRVLKDLGGIAPGEILVRDLGGEHDIALKDDHLIDLAVGNVFYAVSDAMPPNRRANTRCQSWHFSWMTGRRKPCAASKRVAWCGSCSASRWMCFSFGITNHPMINSSVWMMWFGLPTDPCFTPAGLTTLTITVKINGKDFVFHEASASVQELKKRAGIPLADVLTKIVHSQMVPLEDNAVVDSPVWRGVRQPSQG